MKGVVILIAEGDGTLRQDLKERLSKRGYKISDTSDGKEVLRILALSKPALAILGSFQNGGWDGLELAEQICRQDRNLTLILINQDSSEKRVIAALRIGVNDYIKIPISYEELVASVSRMLADIGRISSANVSEQGNEPPIIGESFPIQEVKSYLKRVAATDCSVLISGETGTGKKLVARLIHQSSRRHEKPMVYINCAALPDSLLESELFGYEKGAFTGAQGSYEGKLTLAQGGTVFMDEIGEMSLAHRQRSSAPSRARSSTAWEVSKASLWTSGLSPRLIRNWSTWCQRTGSGRISTSGWP
jgi:DNA-binding NtrC family response regulator